MRRLILPLLLLALLTGCARQDGGPSPAGDVTWESLTVESSLELQYAGQFSVDRCHDGYQRITIGGRTNIWWCRRGRGSLTGCRRG